MANVQEPEPQVSAKTEPVEQKPTAQQPSLVDKSGPGLALPSLVPPGVHAAVQEEDDYDAAD